MIIHILGGGSGQMSAVRRCRSMGLTTFVTDANPDAPGCVLADYSDAASTFDAGQTIDAALRFKSKTGSLPNAILVTGTDQPVLTAARVSEELKIPYFLNSEQALLVTNKKIMKDRLSAAGIPVSPYRFISSGFEDAELKGLSFPIVTKPLDSQGQRGVYRLETEKDLRSRMDEVLGFSRCDEILVEEYYPSTEITLSGWLEDGRLHILSVTDRVTVDNPPGIGVCISHQYPSRHSSRMPEIRKITEDIMSAFGLNSGPVYFQYLVGNEGPGGEPGRIIVNEAACRLGGAYEDEFLPIITGIDVLGTMINFSCRREYDTLAFKSPRGKDVVSIQMFFCRTGIIKRQSGMDEVLRAECVAGGSFLLPTGTEIKNRLNSTQRAGYFIVHGDTEEGVDSIVKNAYSKLRIEDENGSNMIQFYDKMLFGGKV